MSRRKRKQYTEDKAEIDLTPMLDVVFIMLIFFIVTASFIKEKSINVNTPPQNEQNQPPDSESKNILIQVKSNDEIFIDTRRVDVRAVRSLIAQKKTIAASKPAVTKAKATAPSPKRRGRPSAAKPTSAPKVAAKGRAKPAVTKAKAVSTTTSTTPKRRGRPPKASS